MMMECKSVPVIKSVLKYSVSFWKVLTNLTSGDTTNVPEVLPSADIPYTRSALRPDNLDDFYIKKYVYMRFCAYERSYPFSAHVIPIPP
jgi:hypothetical protein